MKASKTKALILFTSLLGLVGYELTGPCFSAAAYHHKHKHKSRDHKNYGDDKGPSKTGNKTASKKSSNRASQTKKEQSESKTASRTKGKALKEPDEPQNESITPGYEDEVGNMAKAYELRDQALSRLIEGDRAQSLDLMVAANKLSRVYWRRSTSLDARHALDTASCAEDSGQFSLAKESYLNCLRQNPTFLDARLRLINLLARTGQYGESFQEAQRFVESNPDDPRGHLILSLLLERQGDFLAAKQEEQKSQSLLGLFGQPKTLLDEAKETLEEREN